MLQFAVSKYESNSACEHSSQGKSQMASLAQGPNSHFCRQINIHKGKTNMLHLRLQDLDIEATHNA